MVKKQTNSKRFERRKQKNTSKEGLRNKNPNKNSPEKNNIAITSFIQNTPSRYLAIYELIIQINRLANHVGIHEKYVFQVTYLYDYFMKKTKKVWPKMQCISILYHCMTLVDKIQNYQIFGSNNFGALFEPNIEFEIFETVDFEIDFEDNIYDIFNKFYYNLVEKYKEDKSKLAYLKSIRGSYLSLAFFLMFHSKWVGRDLMTSFISCLYFSYENVKYMITSDGQFFFAEIQKLISKYNYIVKDREVFLYIIDESNYIYNILKIIL